MNYYLVTCAAYCENDGFRYNELLVADKALTYEEIKSNFKYNNVIEIEVLEWRKYEDKN